MEAVLVSFFDSNNIGDLLISDLLYKKTKNHFNNVTKINYLDGKEVPPRDKIEIEPFEGNKVSRPKSTKEKIAGMLATLNLTSLNYLYLSKIKQYKLDTFEEKIKNADVLVIGGGNMIFDIYERTLVAARFNEYVEIAKKYNKKVFAMSLGIGPFQTDYQEEAAISALAKCDYVTFRDQKSFDIYKKRRPAEMENVHVAVDPVFSLPKQIENPQTHETVGLNIINNPEYTQDEALHAKVVKGYVTLTEKLLAENKIIKLFSTETRDYEVINDVYAALADKENVEVVHISSFDAILDLYSELSLLIAARMHSMIIAYTQMVPVVGLSWQPKVQAMFDIIDESDHCFNLLDVEKQLDEIVKVSLDKVNEDTHAKMNEQIQVIMQKEGINEQIFNELVN